MNIVTLLGRLTADPEVRTTQNNVEVASFTVAVQRTGSADTTDFIPCVAWRQTAEFVGRYFHKGKMIALSGSLQSRKYTENATGKTRTAYEVVVSNVWFAGDKSEGSYTAARDNASEGVQKASAGFSFGEFDFSDFTKIDRSSGDLPF